MAEKLAQALDDRQPQPQAAAALAGGVVELMVFLEDRLQLGGRNADSGVPDLDAQLSPAAPASDQHFAALGVFEGVRKQVADHLLEQARIGANELRAGQDAQREARRLRVVGQLLPEAVEQIIHRDVGDFGLNGAHLDLIDVEQRVQHAGHRAQSFVDANDQTLGPVAFDLLGQQALKQGKRLQRLTQIVARRREKARLGHGGQFGLSLGGGQRVGRAPPFGHVFKGYDDALGLLVAGAIGQDPTNVPVAALTLDLPIDRRLALEDLSRVVEQGVVGGQRFQVGERAPDVARDHVEQRLGRRREKADVEAGVEEDRRDVGAVKHVLQIVRGRALPVKRLLQLAVERVQFLVERLKLLFGGEQLFVGRLIFLVDGQRLVVDRHLLFAGGLQVADGALEFGLGRLELPFEFDDPRDVGRRNAAAREGSGRRRLDETHQQQVLALARRRFDDDLERRGAGFALGLPAGHDDARVVAQRALNGRLQLDAQALARHGDQVVRRAARRDLEIAIDGSLEVETFELAVDHHRGRTISLQHHSAAEFGKVGLARRRLGRSGDDAHPCSFAGARRQADVAESAAADASIEALGFGDDGEPAVGGAEGFRIAEKQKAAFAQGKMEDRGDLRLRLGAQVDQ